MPCCFVKCCLLRATLLLQRRQWKSCAAGRLNLFPLVFRYSCQDTLCTVFRCCVIMFLVCLIDELQSLHVKFFDTISEFPYWDLYCWVVSPWWSLMCLLKLWATVNLLPQGLHWWTQPSSFISPTSSLAASTASDDILLWAVCRWILRLKSLSNCSPQNLHGKVAPKEFFSHISRSLFLFTPLPALGSSVADIWCSTLTEKLCGLFNGKLVSVSWPFVSVSLWNILYRSDALFFSRNWWYGMTMGASSSTSVGPCPLTRWSSRNLPLVKRRGQRGQGQHLKGKMLKSEQNC